MEQDDSRSREANTIVRSLLVFILITNGIKNSNQEAANKAFSGDNLTDTSTPAKLYLSFNEIALVSQSILLDYGDGYTNSSTRSPNIYTALPEVFIYEHWYPIQGQYVVTADVTDSEQMTVTLNVWNSFGSLRLIFSDGTTGKYITNTLTTVAFDIVPYYGFEYTIDWDDGSTIEQNVDESLLYAPYNLGHFTHIFTEPDMYNIKWEAKNGFYHKIGELPTPVQNKLPTQAYEYVLEPINKLFPLAVPVPFHITLNPDFPRPTGAQCVFYAEDGDAVAQDLVFVPTYTYTHTFKAAGTFNSVIYCENHVSNHTFRYNNTVTEFRSEFISIGYVNTVPLNVSSTKEIFLHLTDGGFALFPKGVSLTFTFDDGTIPKTYNYDKSVYSNVYDMKGNYTIKVLVVAEFTSTQTEHNLPLRLGYMHFEHTMTTAFFDRTLIWYYVWGVPGSSVTYTVDYIDETVGSCTLSNDIYGCDMSHVFLNHGIKTVVARVDNGTFVEIDEMEITVDGEIKNLIPFIPFEVNIPDGRVTVILNVSLEDSYLPDLNCKIRFADSIDREERLHIQWLRHALPFTYNFQYISLGRGNIEFDCWNLLNSTSFEYSITVTNQDFLYTGSFDRYFSQVNTPLPMSAMKDNEVFCRLMILADFNLKTPTYAWSFDTHNKRATQLIPRGSEVADTYLVTLNVSFIEQPENLIYEPTYILIVDMSPLPFILGGQRRLTRVGDVRLDATGSFDPVDLTNTLTFTWTCMRYSEVTSLDDLVSKHTAGAGSTPCTLYAETEGVKKLDNSSVVKSFGHVVSVMVNNRRGLTSTYAQHIVTHPTEDLSIVCRINCLAKVAVRENIHLQTTLATTHCSAEFSWMLSRLEGTSYVAVPLEDITETGSQNQSFVLKGESLLYGAKYLVTVQAVVGLVNYGPTYYEFRTNQAPKGGNCTVFVYGNPSATLMNSDIVAKAAVTDFNMTCMGWMDEGEEDTFSVKEPLNFEFYLKYGQSDQDKHMVYFDSGGTSPLVTFRAGDVNSSYSASVIIRIFDVYGDYAELIMPVTVEPELSNADLTGLNSTQAFTVVKSYLNNFDDFILKANRSYDYRTLATKIEAVASIYTPLEVETEESTSTFTSDQLTSLGTMRSEDGSLMDWTELWDVIFYSVAAPTQAYLTEKNNMYAAMLLFQVQEWPVGKRMSLEAIEIVARAFRVLVSNRDYTNNVTTIHASDFVQQISVKLKVHLEDRILVSANRIMDINQVLVDITAGVLDYLQTVLTPLLPDDPTSDEMRKYLEYISVFQQKEVTSQLSLQEQTFLVQKQLQKYQLQKYLKSQNSLLVVPLLVTAMKTIGTSMERLSEIGQRPLELDNTFLHVSTEVITAAFLNESLLVRDKVTIDLTGLIVQTADQDCSTQPISAHIINYKVNPFFWGTFGDRLTSYTSTFYLTGADVSSSVTVHFEYKQEADCVEQTPVYAEDDPASIIYILFDRVYSDDDMLLFIKPNTTGITYDLFFQTEDKPDIAEEGYFYTTSMNTDIWTAEDGFKLPITAENIPYTGKIWIALRPIISPESEDMRDEIVTAKFCASITTGNCLAWKKDPATGDNFWDKDSCMVSAQSSRKKTICICEYMDSSQDYTIGTTFFVPFSNVDFSTMTSTIAKSNTPVVGALALVAIIYLIFICWAWREDVKDQYKWAYAPLIDNDIADNQFFFLRVYTGLRSGSGTNSRVGFILVGEEDDTGVRIMDDDTHIGFDRGSVRTFVLSTRRTLGELMCMRVWHDDTGKAQSSWYLNKITVVDLQNQKRYLFPCNQWLSSEEGDEAVDRVLYVHDGHPERSVIDTATYTLVGNHLWLSCFLCPFRSNFRRTQKCSCLLAILFISMFVSMLQFDTNKRRTYILNEVIVGPLRFSLMTFSDSLLSSGIATLVVCVACFLFRYSKPAPANHNSILRRIYKTICLKTKFDKSILASIVPPPTSPAVQNPHHFIPHFGVYIAWCIIAVVVVLTSYLLATTTKDWPQVTSERWMTTLVLSACVSMVLLETGKAAVQIVLSLIIFERQYEPAEPSVDIDRLIERTRKSSIFTMDGPQFKGLLHYPEVPNKETLLDNKNVRLEESQAMSILYKLILYIFLLLIVYTISFASRDIRSYQFKLHQEQLFNFDSVKSIGTFIDWLNITFISNYFANSYFGSSIGNDTIKSFTNDLSNIKVGPARLRQVRVRKEPCLGPLGVGVTCYPLYATTQEDTIDYCLGWKNTPCPIREKADYFTSPAWVYHSTEEVWGFPTEAEFKTYGGGGYFMKLDVNKDVSLEIFKELTQQSWIDRQTRTVILEFTVYNPNSNLFSYTKFVAEFPEVGGVIPYTDIQTFRLFTHSGADGDLVMFCEFFFLIYVIITAILVFCDFVTHGLRFFSSIWRILDLVMLAMSIAIVSLFIYKLVLIEKTISLFREDMNAYIGFENLAFYDVLVNTIHSLLVFLLTLLLSRVLGFSGKINEMAAVVSNSAKDLAGFSLIFFISYIAYTLMGTLLFGKDTKTYKTFFDSYGTLTGAIIGRNKVQEIMISNPGLAEFFYFTFVLCVLLTLVTMASAILNFNISDVKSKTKTEKEPPNAAELIFVKVKMWVDAFSHKPEQSGAVENSLWEESDADAKEILEELRTSMKKIIGKFKRIRSSDKYRM